MNTIDFFDLNKPGDLYRIILDTYSQYVEKPTEKDFLFLVLGLSHLREWIAESKRDDIERKQRKSLALTDGERFFVEIHAIPPFRDIQELCNRGKHRITRGSIKTSKSTGPQPGRAMLGDKSDQTYFLINGRDSREYFIELIHKYNEWFSEHGD